MMGAMNGRTISPNQTKLIFIIPFLTTLLYTTYLFFFSSIQVTNDALEYERLGKIIYEHGLVGYFQNGPAREPLYPLLITLSMKIASWTSFSYLKIQTIIQIAFLLLTQFLTYRLLRRLNITPWIISTTILYIGFSPALINSTFSLYSEIITYPLILAIIFVILKTWRMFEQCSIGKAFLQAALLTFLFILITCVKAIFGYIAVALLFPFIILLMRSLFKKNYRVTLNSFVFITTFLILLGLFMFSFKSLNKKYNGFFNFADRGYLLYANSARRTIPFSMTKLKAAIAYIPGEGLCPSMADHKDDCYYWSIASADGFGYRKCMALLDEGVPRTELESHLNSAAVDRVLKSPIPYIFFTFLESLKMFFWESTKIGSVTYPSWLEGLFDNAIFKNGLRFTISIITIWSMIYLAGFVWRKRKFIFDVKSAESEIVQIYFFMLVLIGIFVGLYSLIQIIPRYLFTIVPFYLIAIAFYFEQKLTKRVK